MSSNQNLNVRTVNI